MLKYSHFGLFTLTRQYSLPAKALATGPPTFETKNKKLPSEDFKTETPINSSFLERSIGSSYRKWHKVLQEYPELKSISRNDIINSANALRALNFTIDDILLKPMILYTNSLTLENRYKVMQECGMNTITISFLAKFITVMNKTVKLLKSFNHIPFELDMTAQLRNCFKDIDVHIPHDYECSEDMKMKVLRQQVLNCYLRQRLSMTDKDIEKLWIVYGRVRHKNFHSIQEMIQLLLEELNFSKERIRKNVFLLYGEPRNVRRILKEIQNIDGQDMHEIAYRRPKILMSSCDALLKTLEHVKSYGINEGAILRCLEVLTLGPDTVLERLRDLNEIEEFQVLGTNPRVLRLVHYQNKARLRLEYLNQLKVRCASLHILSCGSGAFAKFARDGSDRTKGCDIVVFLTNIMGKPDYEIRSKLIRHPNWCHVPVIHVKQCYEFMLSKKFTVDDIFNNLHLLLYPIKRIDEKILQLTSPGFLEDMHLEVEPNKLSNSEMLTLILYLIECEFHFTGDGIWNEQHTQQVENFHNLLPDFPASLNKVYKYGVKPVNHESQNNFLT